MRGPIPRRGLGHRGPGRGPPRRLAGRPPGPRCHQGRADRRPGLRLSAGGARDLRRARYALWKNPENLSERQQAKLAWIEKTHPLLYRAYLLKEGLRTALKLNGEEARYALDRWLAWAARCRIPEFTTLGRRIRAHLPAIRATIEHGLSNGLIESANTKIRLLTRMAFGFHNPSALIALAMLALGGLRPALPGR